MWAFSANLNASQTEAPRQELESTLRPYLETYCISCHGPEKAKGDRRWDTLELQLPIQSTESLYGVQEILDILNLGEMPPHDEELQPTPEETQRIVHLLTDTMESQYALIESTGQETVFRRLNRREYRNTIRDLLKLNTTAFDPSQSFPRDQTDHHLDTIGNHLVTSGYLLDKYLEAADAVIEKVFALSEKPEPQTYFFTDNFKQQPELDRALQDWANYEFIALYETPISARHEGAYAKIHTFEDGVPHDGYYRIRVNAIAKNRIHDHEPRRVSTIQTEPIRLGIVTGNRGYGDLSRPQPIEPQLAVFELKDEVLEWREATVWLDAGDTPRFTYPNGMLGLRENFGPIAERIAAESKGELKNVDFSDRRLLAMKYGKLPHIQIHDVEIEGPIYDSWPPPFQQTLLGNKPFAKSRVRSLVADFAAKAYRRPVKKAEIDDLMRFAKQRRRAGVSDFQAYKDTLKRILCSPSFLYLEEPKREEGRIDAFALASRLSYFVWSSMPDEKLFKQAESKQLQNPDTLKSELKRLLEDENRSFIVDNFIDTCLTLKDLGTQPPDRRGFPMYYSRNLRENMREETRLFVKHALAENLPLTEFIEADYSFLNESLAELYEYEGVKGNAFRKVALPNAKRSGILGHASILTVSANGVDTSPVTRGVWLLENILGTPPSPPPPDVEPFDPDTRGSTSLREQLEKHRENPTCYDCHRKIDPMGFPFENFDAIGRWRDHYPKGGPIDPSSQLADGTPFADIVEFKAALKNRVPQMSRAWVTKLLSLATGRKMEPADRPEIERIVEELAARGDGFYDLIELVALSPTFQSI